MSKDKAIRAAKLTAKQVISHNAADKVADLLRQGRAKEVTDDLMVQADPQRLHHHYITGNTGVDMPMDQASRMKRARKMGLTSTVHRGQRQDKTSFEENPVGKNFGAFVGPEGYDVKRAGTFFTNNPEFANEYTKDFDSIGNPITVEGSVTGKYMVPPAVALPHPSEVAEHFLLREDDAANNAYKGIKYSPHGWQQLDDEAGSAMKMYADEMGHKSHIFSEENTSSENEDEMVSGKSSVVYNPTNIRSQFARFDPRLAHLSHLSASTGGAMELARAVVAKNRADGQIAPSKYMPNVPRQVRADGGEVENAINALPYVGQNRNGVPPEEAVASPLPRMEYPYMSMTPAKSVYTYPLRVAINKAHAEAKIEDVPMDKIFTDVSAIGKSKIRNPSEGVPFVERINGVHHLRDGNHRAAAAFLRGDKSIKALVADMDEAIKASGRSADEYADGGAANAPMFQGIHESLQNESGAPLDLYHGTTQDKEFEAFDDAKLGARDAGFYGRGHYLAPLKGNAEGYADPDEMGRGTVIGPLHAALKNPYVWDMSDDMKSHSTLRDLQSMGIMRDKKELRSWDNLQSHHVQPFMAEMQKRGHDGVVVKTGHEHLPNGISEVVAFDPKTIKHTEAEAFDPTDPRIRREDGGRTLNQHGLYSKALEVAKKMTQAKGTPEQFMAQLKSTKGVKPAELEHIGMPSGDKITRDDFIKHIRQNQPQLNMAQYGENPSYITPAERQFLNESYMKPLPPEDDKRRSELYARSQSRVHHRTEQDDDGEVTDAPTNYEDYSTAGGKNYRERLIKLGGEPQHSSSHWHHQDDNNIVAHVRMQDRAGPNGEKLLHVEEMQSDWGQEGRKRGFLPKNPPYGIPNENYQKLARLISDLANRGLDYDARQAHPDVIRAAEILEKSQQNYKGEVPAAPYVQNTQHWTDLAMKNIMREAALGDYDGIVFTPGQVHADRYSMEDASGMKGYYDNIVPKSAMSMVQQHDPSIKPQTMNINGEYDAFHVPMTREAKDSIIKNGFSTFRRGGTVAKAAGGAAMGYVPLATLPTGRLAVAPIQQPQQQQNTVGRFSDSLMSLSDTIKDFKKKPELEDVQNTVDPSAARNTLATTSAPPATYDATGMSEAAAAAYGRLTDAYGRPLNVISSFRDKEHNAEVGGADNSQHTHGNAYDVDVSGKTYEERLALANQAWDAGFRGIGFYDNSMHFDVGDPRGWGPSHSRDSIPDWARPFTDERYGYAQGGTAMNRNSYQNGGFENGTTPINFAARPQAGELQNAGGVRGGAGLLQTQNEAPLEGLPQKVGIPLTGGSVSAGPDPRIRQVARDYMASTGMQYNPPTKYAKADPNRARRIAAAYDAMKDDPNEPLTKASYDAMIKETMAQYNAAKKAGLKVEFWNPDKEQDPYGASPRLATEDVRNNHHMWVYPTYAGYGSGDPISEDDAKKNPLLQLTGETWNGIPVTVNDVFRAVHDYYGHAKEGVGFRADGEENAWRAHASMFSPLARMAMTSETRGQNSWLNYGPHGEKNRTARTEDTVFAPQKIGILPHWAHHEGAEDFTLPEDVHAMHRIRSNFDPVVSKALSLTRGFTKDGKSAISAVKTKGE